MTRICHINLARGYRGGERQTELLIRALAEAGVSQRAVVRARQPLAERLRDVPGLEILPVRRPFTRALPWLRGHLLHAHEGKGAHLAHWANLWTGAPYLVTRRIARPPSDRYWTRRIYRRAGRVAAVAEAVRRALRDYDGGIRTAVVHSAVSELPVDPARAAALKRGFGDRIVVGNVAALDDAQKGQSLLLDVARELERGDPRLLFVLVGDGPDRGRFERRAAGLGNVRFEGFIDNVGDYLAAFDVFALPSRHEGIGGILLDAMSAGLPVVATAVDGLPEIVRPDFNGILVPPGDATALRAAVERLARDADLRRRLGANGRAFAADFSPREMARRYLEIYRTLGFDTATREKE